MKLFVASSYSTKVNYDTGEVFPEFKTWLEELLTTVENAGHEVFSALRADDYKINDTDPAEAFFLDKNSIDGSDAILAMLDDEVSPGVQVEIGYGVAKGKVVILAHEADHKMRYFNAAMVRAGVVKELTLPLTAEKIDAVLQEQPVAR